MCAAQRLCHNHPAKHPTWKVNKTLAVNEFILSEETAIHPSKKDTLEM